MDSNMLKEIFEWGSRHEDYQLSLEAKVCSFKQSVGNMKYSEDSRYENEKAFNGFIRSTVDGISSSIRIRENGLLPSPTSDRADTTNLDNEYRYSRSRGVDGTNLLVQLASEGETNVDINNVFESFSTMENLLSDSLLGSSNLVREKGINDYFTVEKETHSPMDEIGVCENEDGSKSKVENVLLNLDDEENPFAINRSDCEIISTFEMEKQLDEEIDIGVDENICEEVKNRKTGTSRRDRQLSFALDPVGIDQEDEIVMEGGNVNPSSSDVLNDTSQIERQNLQNEEVPCEILRLVYGNELYNSGSKQPYPITCERACKGETHLAEKFDDKLNLGQILKFRTINYCFPDNATMMYTLDNSYDVSEIIVATDSVVVRRSHLLSLRDNQFLESQIVNAMVDMLRRDQLDRSPLKLKYWWIPTTVSRPKRFKYDVMSQRSEWDPWVGHLSDCEKIYIPICAKRHWFVAIVDIIQGVVLVYDDLVIPSVPLGTAIVDTILKSLDKAFVDEIRILKGSGWSFDNFPILPPMGMKFRCNKFDCGVNAIKLMQAAYNADKICNHGTTKDERLCVLFQLIMSVHNKVRWSVLNRAITSAKDLFTPL